MTVRFKIFAFLIAGVTFVNSKAADIVPRVVAFGGTAKDPGGRAITGMAGGTFSIYASEDGGGPLWMETQNIQVDSNGHYDVQLGVTKPDGVPVELFTSGEARWLGVSINGAPELPRVLLLSVPYALKAGDAQTLGGLPPSAFALAAPPPGSADAPLNGALPRAVTPGVAGTGAPGFVPLWTDSAGNLGNSVLFQSGSGSSARIGINSTTPAATLDVKGTAVVRGTLSLPATGMATAGAGKRSQTQNFTASSYNSATNAAVSQTFQWQAEPAFNGTPSPSAAFNLLFGSGGSPPGETGLSIAGNGQITFAPGQTFPGAGSGTITGVTAGTDLTGGGSTGNVTLGLDTTKVPQLGAANTFTGDQNITGNVSTTGNISATGSVSGATAVFSGTNTTQIGQVSQFGTGSALLVQQNDTGTAPEIALFATAAGKGAIAIEGYANNASSGATGTGVTGAAFGPLGTGVFGYASNSAGGTGVEALSSSASGIAAVLDNTAGGKILSARHNGAEVFSVDGTGNVSANGNITTQGGQAIIRSGSVPAVLTNTAGGTILIGYNNNTQKFSFDGNGSLATAGSVSAALFSGSGSGLTGIPLLTANNTFTGSQTILGNLAVGAPGAPALMQTSGKDSSGTGIQTQSINTSTSGNSYAVFAATSSAGVTAEFVADGLGTGPMGAPSGYFGTYTNQPVGFVTANTPRMVITTAGNVGIGTMNPGSLVEADAPANSNEVAISARGGSTGTAFTGASAIVATGALNIASASLGGAGITATGGLAIGAGSGGGTGVLGMGGQASNNAIGSDGGDGGYFSGGSSASSSGGAGIIAIAGTGAATGWGGEIFGDLDVLGNIFGGSKNFKIDHPLDPANKYLVHTSVESSEMLNIYSGNVTTDSRGGAAVVLPEWFQELNTDFRYQLTVIGQFAQAIVSQEISNGQFSIKTDKPNVKVSWQVSCVRQDPYAKAHPLEVEQLKPQRERGYYSYPELYGAPAEKSVQWARHARLAQHLKDLQQAQATK